MVIALDALANAVEMFWVSVIGAVVVFLVGLGSAIAGVAGVVTAPPGIVVFFSFATVAVGLITAAVTAFYATIQPINTQTDSVQKTIDDLGGKWGTADNGVDLSDGSSSDGDESNWEAR